MFLTSSINGEDSAKVMYVKTLFILLKLRWLLFKNLMKAV